MALTVAQAFAEFKERLELSESLQDKVVTHHNTVREWIESQDLKIESELIGSLQRKTRIQPRPEDTFDIDILIIFGEFHQQAPDGISPIRALDKLESIVKEHGTYRKLGVETDSPTITFEYKDNIKVELVPAWRDFIYAPKGRGYRVPKRSIWTSADYDYDADYISRINKGTDGCLIPTIKMLKAAKRNMFPEMESYHLEVLAAEVIPIMFDYLKREGHQISYIDLIYDFFYIGKARFSNPLIIPNTKSPNADKYLADYERRALSEKFREICNYCKSFANSDGREAIEKWRVLFGQPFPSYD